MQVLTQGAAMNMPLAIAVLLLAVGLCRGEVLDLSLYVRSHEHSLRSETAQIPATNPEYVIIARNTSPDILAVNTIVYAELFQTDSAGKTTRVPSAFDTQPVDEPHKSTQMTAQQRLVWETALRQSGRLDTITLHLCFVKTSHAGSQSRFMAGIKEGDSNRTTLKDGASIFAAKAIDFSGLELGEYDVHVEARYNKQVLVKSESCQLTVRGPTTQPSTPNAN